LCRLMANEALVAPTVSRLVAGGNPHLGSSKTDYAEGTNAKIHSLFSGCCSRACNMRPAVVSDVGDCSCWLLSAVSTISSKRLQQWQQHPVSLGATVASHLQPVQSRRLLGACCSCRAMLKEVRQLPQPQPQQPQQQQQYQSSLTCGRLQGVLWPLIAGHCCAVDACKVQ